jgi:hypothetical protein
VNYDKALIWNLPEMEKCAFGLQLSVMLAHINLEYLMKLVIMAENQPTSGQKINFCSKRTLSSNPSNKPTKPRQWKEYNLKNSCNFLAFVGVSP